MRTDVSEAPRAGLSFRVSQYVLLSDIVGSVYSSFVSMWGRPL